MSTSANQPPTSGTSSPALSEASSATELQSNSAATRALQDIASSEQQDNDGLWTRRRPSGAARKGHMGEADDREDMNGEKTTGWLVTSCDVATTEPRSLSQELERLQVLKSYHIMDPERDESFDRLTRMASRILETPYTFLSLVDMGRIWFRSNPDSDCEQQLTRDNILSALARVIMKHDAVFDIPDINLDDNFRQGGGDNSTSASSSSNNLNSNNNRSDNSSGGDATNVQFRFFAGAPLLSPEGYRLGAVCMLDPQPRSGGGVTDMERENLKDLAELAVKTMVDRRKLTTQGSPSHLVACTAHDLITPLTGIQLSLSLLQQDGDFQAKLGDKRQEHISSAVRSSNMMLRICQSTIETLRGNRKIPAGTDWSLPRNLMQIAESSPFIDMKEFTANLEAISSSIPKKAPLQINLHPSAPINIVSDGLKIFRSALNLLANACSRAESGAIVMTIFDDEDGSLVFECEDDGKEIETRDSQSLFNQDNDLGNFGLYSVAYQINWLGGKYGIRKRTHGDDDDGEDHMRVENINTMDNANVKDEKNGTSRRNDERGKGDNPTIKKYTIFWFSIPIVLPQDVSELMGLAKSLSNNNNSNNQEASIPTFRADMPVTPPASPQIDDSNEATQSSPTIPKGVVKKGEATRTLNALIIEDSTTVRKILGRALSKMGYQVFEAVDGMEGLRELKNTMFDMVLCDFLMPVMDGLDCVKQYREWEVTNRQVFRQYIVGISAHASRNDIERGLKLGMDDFKPKPIVLKTLTGLHDSDALKAVRASLDNLLNLPSLEVQRRRLSIGTYNNNSTRLADGDTDRLTIPAPLDPSEKSEDDGPPLFAVPRRPSQLAKDKPPLFSIPPELTESGRGPPKDKTGPSPLFAIPTKQTNTNQKSSTGTSNSAPLFSIPMSKSTAKPLFSLPTKNEGGHQKPRNDGSNLAPLFGIPSNKSGSSPLFGIPAKQDEANKKPLQEAKGGPLFSIPESKSVSSHQSSQARRNNAPLFSIPSSASSAQKTQNEGLNSPPLFSISTKQSETGQKSSPKPALFSIAVNPTASEGQKRPALFSLGSTEQADEGRKAKKPPLFTIAINPTEPPTEAKKPKALFSIVPNSTTKPGESSQHHTKDAPLFSITSNSTKPGGHSQTESKTAPLFSIASNATKAGGQTQQIIGGHPPLFSIPSNSTKSNVRPRQESKQPPLFTTGSNSTKSGGQTTKHSKNPPLFSITPGGKDGQSQTKATKPALFEISVNPTAPGGASKKPSVLDASGIANLVNGSEAERPPKRPALFALPGKAGESMKETPGDKDTRTESADGNTRPKKTMKRALFDIATQSNKK